MDSRDRETPEQSKKPLPAFAGGGFLRPPIVPAEKPKKRRPGRIEPSRTAQIVSEINQRSASHSRMVPVTASMVKSYSIRPLRSSPS